MKGKISKIGTLLVKRGKEYKEQECPYSRGDYPCGDWCTLFGEPSSARFPAGSVSSAKEEKTALQICQGRTLVFSEFVDEREELLK